MTTTSTSFQQSQAQQQQPQFHKQTHEGEHHGDYSGTSSSSLPWTRYTIIYALCASLNSCNLGYDIGVSTNAGSLIQQEFQLTNVQRELFIGSLNFWSIFGSLFSHWICDRYGRKFSFQVAAVSFIVGLIFMASANGYTLLMIGRCFVGLGVGFGLAIDPLYIAEVSPAAHRGELVTWSEMAINVGIVLGFFSGIVFYNVDNTLEWRLMFAMGTIMPCIMIVLSRTVMVESPRWLVSQHRIEEATQILQTIYPPGFDVEPVTQDIKEALERERLAEKHQIGGWNSILFPTKAIRRMLLVGIGTAVAQQAVGIDAIQYYLIDVLEQSGIQSDKAQLGVLMLLGVLKLLFVIIGSKLLDRTGRRLLFFVSLIGMCGACVLTSFSFFGSNNNNQDNNNNPSPTFAIVGLSLYLSFFSIGMGPGAWLIPSEIFATSIRAKAMSMATFFNRITATFMSSTFLSTANAIGWGPFFLMLAAICVVVFLFLFFLLPETKGRSLEDMSLYFAEITQDHSLLEAERKILSDRAAAMGSGIGGVEMTTTPNASTLHQQHQPSFLGTTGEVA